MSTFFTFAQLGYRHIVDVSAMDHILFLLALAAVYRFRDWRDALWVVSAFTVGHSITLALAVTNVLRVPAPLIEFLIPLTIVAAGLENLLVRHRERMPWRGRYRAVFAGAFGLIHGAGFATYLRSLFVDQVALPLFGFNVGIEAGQIVVLLGAAVLLTGVDRALAALRLPRRAPAPLRIRVIAISLLVTIVAAKWAIERRPW